jgi:predicted nucleic acid-binding protein
VILADTSVWIDHLRNGNGALIERLNAASVLMHPFVLGEVAMGQLRQRELVVTALSGLPRAAVATDSEVLEFIQMHALFGRGIGYVDVHLLAAVRLTATASLWTLDKKLHFIAGELGIASPS